MKTRKKRNSNQSVRTLVLPVSITQNHDAYIIQCFHGQATVHVKNLQEQQDTVLDLMENLPKFLRWMKKDKNRSLSVDVQKDGNIVLYCEISHADKEPRKLSDDATRYEVRARPLKPEANN